MPSLPGSSRGSSTSIHDHLPGKLVVEYLPVATLLLDPKNPRMHIDKQVQQIARSIETFGFISPVLVDAGLHVIAGHGRLRACKILGMKSVPAIRVDHLSEKQRLAFMITDNRLTENSNWDHQLLGEQLKILSEAELDFTLETTGFEIAEIDLIIENLSPAPDGKDDPADAVPETPAGVQVSQAGDLWLLGRHRVYCGSSLNESSYAALMGDAKARMVFSDLLFNVRINGHAIGLGTIWHRDFQMAANEMDEAEFADFLSRVCSLLASHSIDGSIHFICIDWRHLGELLAAGKLAYSELKNICVWVKDNADTGSLYRSQHQMVLAFKHGKEPHLNNIQAGRYGRYRSNVWNYRSVNSVSHSTDEGNLLPFHPAVKPVALVADAISDTSACGDLVLDAFLGSGTTIIAAERTGRKCYGIESNPLMWTQLFAAGRSSRGSRRCMGFQGGTLQSWKRRWGMDSNSDNEVGYGKPPQHSKFKKGRSGNPKGRPKGKPNLATVLEKALREKVVINENGQRKTVTKREAAIKQLVNKAASGDLRALQQLAALARSGEERSAEATPPTATMKEVDQKVLQGVLRRFGATCQGAEDADHTDR
jgi:DNA modification methylase